MIQLHILSSRSLEHQPTTTLPMSLTSWPKIKDSCPLKVTGVKVKGVKVTWAKVKGEIQRHHGYRTELVRHIGRVCSDLTY